ncbi:hypothetical protein ACN6LM_005069 [Streptomyces sp. SAS_281]|uniref:hypothetical protein n=1 Tax=Streptomyces sp. SAS_281 TaxID=3412744 RepID=UPI00403CADA8
MSGPSKKPSPASPATAIPEPTSLILPIAMPRGRRYGTNDGLRRAAVLITGAVGAEIRRTIEHTGET